MWKNHHEEAPYLENAPFTYDLDPDEDNEENELKRSESAEK